MFAMLLLYFLVSKPLSLNWYEVSVTFLAAWLLVNHLYGYFAYDFGEEESEDGA